MAAAAVVGGVFIFAVIGFHVCAGASRGGQAALWCHCTPTDTPTRACNTNISAEDEVDNVAPACDIGRRRGAYTLASNHNCAIIGGAAALLHQGCPVIIGDCQVAEAKSGMSVNFECSES